MKPHLIIFDIDETLYINRENRIPDSTIIALEKLKKAGHTLAIATGRSYYSIIDKIKQLPFDYYILANGQLIVHHDEVIYENAIEKTLIDAVVNEARMTNIQLGFNTKNHSFVTALTSEVKQAFFASSRLPEISTDIHGHGSIYQMWYFSGEYKAISETFKNDLRFVSWLSQTGADILPVGVSKATALTELLKHFPDDPYHKTIFFGDGANDIELIQAVDIGIAMGNGVEALKEVADFVTKNIEDDGIYHACEKLELFTNS